MGVSLARAGFAFGDVADITAKLFKVDPLKRVTFVGRLQQLQKAGIPAGANLGRGVKVRYSVAQLITLMACLDLLDCGATPATLAAYFGDSSDNQNLETLFDKGKGNFGRALQTAEAAELDLYFLFQPAALAYLQSSDTVGGGTDNSSLLIEGDFKALARVAEKPSIVLNMTRRIRELREAVKEIRPDQIAEFDFSADRPVGDT